MPKPRREARGDAAGERSLAFKPDARCGDAAGHDLERVSFRTPAITYLSAVDASEHADAADIRAMLVRQLASPVRWSQTVLALCARGAQGLLECGPGKVLTALNRRIAPREGVTCAALD